jgi:hypothetical protein
LVPDTSISGTRVARELDRLLVAYGKPKTIVSDNGTELTSNGAGFSRKVTLSGLIAKITLRVSAS